MTLQPWEFLETLDLAAWTHHAGGEMVRPARALQILYALLSEIRPEAALQLGAYHAAGAALLIAALNAGWIEDVYFAAPAPSDGFRAVLEHARLPRHVHVAPEAPALSHAEFWLVDGCDRAAIARAFDAAPSTIAAIPRAPADAWRDARYATQSRRELSLALDPGHIDQDTRRLAGDLLTTEQVWWGAPGARGPDPITNP